MKKVHLAILTALALTLSSAAGAASNREFYKGMPGIEARSLVIDRAQCTILIHDTETHVVKGKTTSGHNVLIARFSTNDSVLTQLGAESLAAHC